MWIPSPTRLGLWARFHADRIDERHRRHIDLPFDPDQESRLLEEAGFTAIRVTFQGARVCVFACSKS
jgi:hypothetical protein